MRRLFEKYETLGCILLIVVYVVVNSYCMQNYGLTDYRSLLVVTILSVGLLSLIVKLDRISYYGLTKVQNLRKYLYFIPLILVVSVNLWNGFHVTYTASEVLIFLLAMLNIGFLEELIFRGFLFKMMAKDSVKSAIIVSSITFGMGHIVNLLNGAEFLPTLLQVCYAIAIGYMFVIIFYKSKSLVPCIIAHGLINCFSIFNVENTLSLYVAPVFLVVVPLVYVAYMNKNIKEV